MKDRVLQCWATVLLTGTVLGCGDEPTAPGPEPSASLLSIGLGASIVADAGGPYSGTAGTPVTFRASATLAPLNLVVTYTWRFGDGRTATGATVTHTYSAPGTYTVILTATALAGVVSDSDQTTATIVAPPNAAPVADAGGPYSGTAGSSIAFDGRGSSDPDGNLPLTYAWRFGDGASGTGATPTHTYAAAGTYTVVLTVTDAKGKASAPDNATVTVSTGGTRTTHITGRGTIGTGPAVPGGSRREFDFDATDAPGGKLFYTDWEVVRSDGTAGSLTVDPTTDPETGITFLARSSVDPACVEFGGTGRLDFGEVHEFTVLACDYGSPGANLDTFTISVPTRSYERGGRLSEGEITLSGS